MAEIDGEYKTVLGADAKFKGELSVTKSLKIEGLFEGQIRSKGEVHLTQGSKIAASIEAGNVMIAGHLIGNIVVSDMLQLQSTARIEGDIRTNRLEISKGAVFTGNLVAGDQKPADSAARTPPSGGNAEPAQGAAAQTKQQQPAARVAAGS